MRASRRSFLNKVGASPLLLYGGINLKRSTPWDRLPISCNTYNWSTFFKRQGLVWGDNWDFCLTQFKESGITAIEPAFNNPEEVKTILPYLSKYGISIPSAYVNSLLHEYAAAEDSIKNVLAIADNLMTAGTRILVTNPSPIAWGQKIAKNDQQIKLQTLNLSRLGSELKKRKITLAYHTHDSEMLAGGKEFHHVLQNTNPNDVGFCLDAHWIFRGCENSDLAIFDVIKIYGSRIVELHIRQSTGGIWTETFGAGDIDYQRMAEVFYTENIRPHLVIEQAVEEGSPNTLDGIAAHKISLQKVQEIFATIL